MQRRDSLKLADMLRASEVVATYLHNLDRDDFFSEGIVQDAILRQLTILGEAAFKISTELQASSSEIPWAKIIGFRHRLLHDYFGLDLDAVWNIASNELPVLHRQIVSLLAQKFPADAV